MARTHSAMSQAALPPLLLPPLLEPPLLVPPLPVPPLLLPAASLPAVDMPAALLPAVFALPPLVWPALPASPAVPRKLPSSPQAPTAAVPNRSASVMSLSEGVMPLPVLRLIKVDQCTPQNLAKRGQKARPRLTVGRTSQGRTTGSGPAERDTSKCVSTSAASRPKAPLARTLPRPTS